MLKGVPAAFSFSKSLYLKDKSGIHWFEKTTIIKTLNVEEILNTLRMLISYNKVKTYKNR